MSPRSRAALATKRTRSVSGPPLDVPRRASVSPAGALEAME